MDPWRRKLDRLNRSRQPWYQRSWHQQLGNRAEFATWGKIALACLGFAAIWFLLQDRTAYLGEELVETRAEPVSGVANGERLYREQQYQAALPLILPAADAGDSAAQCMAGKILAQGLGGVVLDVAEGVKWLDLCVRNPDTTPDTDDEEARELLNRLIVSAGWDVVGEGKYRAFQWQQAVQNAELGEPGSASERVLRDVNSMNAEEAFALGADLNAGRNMPVDYAKALQAFKHAAELGLKEALFNVGLSYYAGKGVKADPVAARRWLERAADAGFGEAAKLLGVMAIRGHGMEQDRDLALAYMKRADELGDPEAAAIHDAIAAGIIPE